MRRWNKAGTKQHNVASESGWGEYPRECAAGCGVKPRITKDTLWMETRDGVRRTWHFACHPSQQ